MSNTCNKETCDESCKTCYETCPVPNKNEFQPENISVPDDSPNTRTVTESDESKLTWSDIETAKCDCGDDCDCEDSDCESECSESESQNESSESSQSSESSESEKSDDSLDRRLRRQSRRTQEIPPIISFMCIVLLVLHIVQFMFLATDKKCVCDCLFLH